MTIREELKAAKKTIIVKGALIKCKHGFGNILGILDAKVCKLEKVLPEVNSHECFNQIKNCVVRLEGVLKQFGQITEYEEEDDSA